MNAEDLKIGDVVSLISNPEVPMTVENVAIGADLSVRCIWMNYRHEAMRVSFYPATLMKKV